MNNLYKEVLISEIVTSGRASKTGALSELNTALIKDGHGSCSIPVLLRKGTRYHVVYNRSSIGVAAKADDKVLAIVIEEKDAGKYAKLAATTSAIQQAMYVSPVLPVKVFTSSGRFQQELKGGKIVGYKDGRLQVEGLSANAIINFSAKTGKSLEKDAPAFIEDIDDKVEEYTKLMLKAKQAVI